VIKKYPALVHKEKDSEYGVSFPDFPGCITAGKTQDEAQKLAEEALRFHVEGMLADGDSIPEPLAFEEACALIKKENAIFMCMVSVEVD
jgi:predicted RNase H-like HicB family nuclease